VAWVVISQLPCSQLCLVFAHVRNNFESGDSPSPKISYVQLVDVDFDGIISSSLD
jgi:hypothetical protein